jgi:hypothetical protein
MASAFSLAGEPSMATRVLENTAPSLSLHGED